MAKKEQAAEVADLSNPVVQAAIQEAAAQAVRQATANQASVYEARISELEARNKLRDDPKALDRLRIVVAKSKVLDFLKPENQRPVTEFYWVTEMENGTFGLPLIGSQTTFNERTGQNRYEESVKLNFTIPDHGIGTDFADAEGRTRYWILRGDLVDVDEIGVTPEDIADPLLRMKPGVKPRPGKLMLRQALEIVREVFEHPISPRRQVFDKEGFNKLMTGEEFRVWAASKYKERWDKEDATKTMRDNIKPNSVLSDDKTGAAISRILATV